MKIAKSITAMRATPKMMPSSVLVYQNITHHSFSLLPRLAAAVVGVIRMPQDQVQKPYRGEDELHRPTEDVRQGVDDSHAMLKTLSRRE
jgi:hypothetical protein